MPIEKLRSIVLSSLMAALTAVGACIHIPIAPVPIVLFTLFVLLSGLLLGSRWGLASIALYLLVGAIGMPVFAGGRGGFAHFFGPTGGYLFGFALSAWITGFISDEAGLWTVWIGSALLGQLLCGLLISPLRFYSLQVICRHNGPVPGFFIILKHFEEPMKIVPAFFCQLSTRLTHFLNNGILPHVNPPSATP